MTRKLTLCERRKLDVGSRVGYLRGCSVSVGVVEDPAVVITYDYSTRPRVQRHGALVRGSYLGGENDSFGGVEFLDYDELYTVSPNQY